MVASRLDTPGSECFYMDVHICAAHQATQFLSEYFAPM